jgi:hypothetical protein
LWPPQLVGLLASVGGMVVGSLLPHFVGKATPPEFDHAALHHHAAAQTGHVAEHQNLPGGH